MAKLARSFFLAGATSLGLYFGGAFVGGVVSPLATLDSIQGIGRDAVLSGMAASILFDHERGMQNLQKVKAAKVFSFEDRRSIFDKVLWAADQGNATALRSVGEFYRDGFSVAVNLDKGWGFMVRAAEAGDNSSRYVVGMQTLLDSASKPERKLEGLDLVEKAADDQYEPARAAMMEYGASCGLSALPSSYKTGLGAIISSSCASKWGALNSIVSLPKPVAR